MFALLDKSAAWGLAFYYAVNREFGWNCTKLRPADLRRRYVCCNSYGYAEYFATNFRSGFRIHTGCSVDNQLQCVPGKNFQRVKTTYRSLVGFSFAFSMAVTALTILFPKFFASMFTTDIS